MVCIPFLCFVYPAWYSFSFFLSLFMFSWPEVWWVTICLSGVILPIPTRGEFQGVSVPSVYQCPSLSFDWLIFYFYFFYYYCGYVNWEGCSEQMSIYVFFISSSVIQDQSFDFYVLAWHQYLHPRLAERRPEGSILIYVSIYFILFYLFVSIWFLALWKGLGSVSSCGKAWNFAEDGKCAQTTSPKLLFCSVWTSIVFHFDLPLLKT